MKRIIATVVFALLAVVAASPSFAKENNRVAHEPRVIKLSPDKTPKFIRFIGRQLDKKYGRSVDMDASESDALTQAQSWIDANHARIRIISHSVTGNYHGHGSPFGFSTVTILYEEK